MLESVESKAKTVSSEVRTCIRTSINALEEKERELLNQVMLSSYLCSGVPLLSQG